MSDVDAVKAEFMASLPPRIDFAPPADILKAYSSKQIVYGIPLSKEWFDKRYAMDASLNPDPSNELSREVHSRGLMIAILWDCRALVQFKCYPTVARSANHGCCTIMVIGRPWIKPTPEELRAIRIKLLRDYRVVDLPVWLPLA